MMKKSLSGLPLPVKFHIERALQPGGQINRMLLCAAQSSKPGQPILPFSA